MYIFTFTHIYTFFFNISLSCLPLTEDKKLVTGPKERSNSDEIVLTELQNEGFSSTDHSSLMSPRCFGSIA